MEVPLYAVHMHRGLCSLAGFLSPLGANRSCVPYSRKLLWVKTFTNFVALPPSANFCVRRLGERVGGVNLIRVQGQSSFAT